MKLSLIQLNGKGKGTIYDVEDGAVCSLGRAVDCDICVAEESVSTRHAKIESRGKFMLLLDLKAKNGTFVNGIRIAEKKLKRGDAITIGSTVFRIRQSSLTEAEVSDADSFFTDTQVIKSPSPVPKHNLFSSPELKDCMHSMQEIMDKHTDELVRESLQLVFKVLPATRISIFSIKDDELVQGYTIVCNSDVPTEHMSKSFAERVLAEGDAVLLENVSDSSADMDSTLMIQEVRSIIGVPIIIQGKKKAVILCDNLDEPNIFSKTHLRVMKFFSRVFEVLYQRDAIYKLDNLEKFLPICATCKKIRDDQGYWNQLESYISQRADVMFSHSICPECAESTMAELDL